MLELRNIFFDYQESSLLEEVNLCLTAGDLVHIQGANGVGKTTLLKVIAGLHRPCQGTIYYQNLPIVEDLSSYQRQLCYIGHKAGINPHLTIKENCFFDVHYHDKVDLHSLLSLFKLAHLIHSPCGLLSAGQKRQVALLRLWYSKASIWLLDEPLVALDEGALMILMEHIASHRARGGMVLLTSHQHLPLAASSYKKYLL